jgi:hypothetical protein
MRFLGGKWQRKIKQWISRCTLGFVLLEEPELLKDAGRLSLMVQISRLPWFTPLASRRDYDTLRLTSTKPDL